MRLCIIVLLSLVVAPAATGASQEAVRLPHFNLDKSGLALQGYDPVSYHQGGPRKGRAAISATYQGVRYHFVSHANRDLFLDSPDAYEPAYGGWCAWAMLDGEKVDVDPESFKLIDGRLYVFYDGFFGDTLQKWNARARRESEEDLVKQADRHWESR